MVLAPATSSSISIKSEPIDMLPSQAYNKSSFSKMESVFESYSASQAEAQSFWNLGEVTPMLTPLPESESLFGAKSLPNATDALLDSTFQALDVIYNTPSTMTVSPMELLSGSSISSGTGSSDGSPLFDDSDLGDANSWVSLFNSDTSTQMVESSILSVPALSGAAVESGLESFDLPSKIELSDVIPSLDSRDSLSPSYSTTSLKRSRESSLEPTENKKDALGFTAYNKKPRSAPLMPVVVEDDGDCTAVKRARNTEAARRSRARKMERMGQLEEKVTELIDENSDLKSENQKLKAEIQRLHTLYGAN